ncbi:MAG: AMP-binding protein, partial [Candidatus Odinarchaeota archaeon]
REWLSALIRKLNFNNCLTLLEEFPFTNPEDVSRNPMSFLSVPLTDIVGFHFTAGTTGKRKLLYVTKEDLDLIVYNYSLGFLWSGIGQSDIAQIMYSFDIWQLGLLFQDAFRRLGVKTIPTGNLITFREQQNFIEEYNVSVLAGTPSYIYQLARAIDLQNSVRERVKAVMLGGEGLPKTRREYIQDRLGGEVFLGYGLMEIGGGVASECSMHNGLHISTTVIPEIVDIKTGERVGVEEYGELVLTSLDRYGMPFIRYRTGDVTRFIDGVCDCGLILPRIDYIKGRLDDRVTLGTAEKYYPIVFEELFESIEEVIDFQIEVTGVDGRDGLKILVKADKPSKDLERKIIGKLYSVSGLRNDIEKTKTINRPKIVFTNQLENYPKRKIIIDKRRAG